LDINPMEKWHTLVIPKKEYETIINMPEWEYLELQRVIFLIAKHYEVTLWCGINIIQNNKTIAGQDVMHVHFHVIPRSVKKDFLNFSVWDNYREWEMQEYKNKLTFDS
jgi:histidine triad (HIT) family protein